MVTWLFAQRTGRLYPPQVVPLIFMLEAEWTPGSEELLKNPYDIGNRIRDLPACMFYVRG